MYYDKQSLNDAVQRGEKLTFTFFYGHDPEKNGDNSCFSQWFIRNFTEAGITYNCMEQFMMAAKARMFKDQEQYDAIMKHTEPSKMKTCGRRVKNFVPAVWDKYCRQIVKLGNERKFGQNEDLFKILDSTGDSILVEASPSDKIWGIGLNARQAANISPLDWPGTNFLGFELTGVRDTLRIKRSGR